jgi:Rap1a immunity proteins
MSEGSGDRSGCRGPKRILGAVVPPFELPDLLSIPFERKHTVREFSEDEKRFLSTRQQILLRRNPEKLRQERATLAAMTDEEREAYLGPPTEDEPVGDRPQVQDGSKTPKRNLAAAAKFRSGTMKGLLAAAAVAGALALASPPASAYNNQTAGALRDDCESNASYCFGYLLGIWDLAATISAAHTGSGKASYAACPWQNGHPKAVVASELRNAFLAYTSAYPDTLAKEPVIVALAAFGAAYPCR